MKKIVPLIFFFAFLKTSAQVQFHKILGGANDERAQTIFSSFDNGYIVNGATLSFGQGYVDGIVTRLDSLGNVSWSKTYGTAGYDNSEFAIETSDHNLVCAGRNSPGMNPPAVASLFKTDSAGNMLWAKSFSGGGDNGFSQVIETSDHGYAAVGYSANSANNSNDFLLIKTDNNGDTIFAKMYGTNEAEIPVSVIQLTDGGYLLSGKQTYQTPFGPEADGLLIRTNSSGDLLWAKTYGDSLWEEITQARISPNGFWLTGSTVSNGVGSYDILLMETDTAGVPLWSKTFGSHDIDAAYDLHITADTSLILSGYTASLGHGHNRGDDSMNIFLMKTDRNGSLQWMQTYGDGLQDEGFRSSIASDHGYLMSAFTKSYNLSDSTEMLIVKTDTTGLTGCHEQRATPQETTFNMPYADHPLTDFLQTSGIITGTLNLVEANAPIISQDVCTILGTNQIINKPDINIFPNPFTGKLNISLNEIENDRIIIHNLTGEIIYDHNIIGKNIEINTALFIPGIYILSIENNEGISRKVIIK